MGTTIAQLIAWVESKGNLEAMRFEPTTYAARTDGHGNVSPNMPEPAASILARIITIHNCSLHTALMIYSSSWGATQIMGFNLYGYLHYGRTVAHYLANDLDQAACFTAYLAHSGLSNVTPELLAADQHERLNFAIRYNGSIAYVTPLMDGLRHFGYRIINLTQ